MFETKHNTKHIKAKWGGTGTQDCSLTYFIKGQAKITPTNKINKEEGEVYPITQIKQEITQWVNVHLHKIEHWFDKRYIFTIDLSETSPSYGKSSFLKFTLFYMFSINAKIESPKEETKMLLKDLDEAIGLILNKYNFKWIE